MPFTEDTAKPPASTTPPIQQKFNVGFQEALLLKSLKIVF
jgi:hypothetical protein